MTEAPPPLPPPAPLQQVPALSGSGLASLVLAAGLIAFISVGALTQLLSLAFGLWWCELFIFFGVPFVALKLSGREPLLSTGFTRPWVQGCAFGFGLGVTNFFAAVAPLMFMSQKIAPQELVDLYDGARVFQDKGPLELLVIVGGVCIAAPLGEEFFFRGVVQRGFGERMKPVVAVLLTGAVFSAFHLDVVGFAARWELGIVFGLLAWRTGSLWPGIFAHLANNLTSTVLYFALKDQPDDPSNDVTGILAIAGIGGLALLSVLLAARRFPSVLQSPQPAREANVLASSPAIVPRWALAGLACIAVLLLVDFRGSVVRAIDMTIAVKEPGEALKAKREQTTRGDLDFQSYWKARQLAAGRRDGGT